MLFVNRKIWVSDSSILKVSHTWKNLFCTIFGCSQMRFKDGDFKWSMTNLEIQFYVQLILSELHPFQPKLVSFFVISEPDQHVLLSVCGVSLEKV